MHKLYVYIYIYVCIQAFYPGSGETVIPHVNAPTAEVISSNIFDKKNLTSTERSNLSDKKKLLKEIMHHEKNNGNEHVKDVHNENDFDDDKEGDSDDDKDDDEDESNNDEESEEESNGHYIHNRYIIVFRIYDIFVEVMCIYIYI
jgi:hypothetical protein